MNNGNGNPVGDKLNMMTVGPRGPVLLQDAIFLDEISHFDRERIPERVVHAKGAGIVKYYFMTIQCKCVINCNNYCGFTFINLIVVFNRCSWVF